MDRQDHGAALPAWADFIARHSDGGVIDGCVVKIVPFGAFIELAEGIHGLLHTKENLSFWTV